MTIAESKQVIEKALETSPFTISGQMLQSQPITKLLTDFFTGDTLVLSDASKKGETDTSITVVGQATQALLGLNNLRATMTFSLSDTDAELHMELDQLPANWKLSDTFPALRNSIFDEFTWASTALTLDSVNPLALPPDFPVSLGYPSYSSAISSAMVQGLGITATVVLASGTGPLEWLLSGNSWSISGPIILPVNQLSICLTTSPQNGVSIGTFSIPFYLSLAAVALQFQPTDPIIITSIFQLGASIEKDLDGKKLTIPVTARESSASSPTLIIESRFSQAQGLSSKDIPALIGMDISGQVPSSSSFPALDAIQIKDVTISIAAATRKMLSVGVTVVYQTPMSYPIFDKLITFNDMEVTFTYIPAGYGRDDGSISYVMTDVSASATIAGGKLDAAIALPDFSFSCSLVDNSTIDITELVNSAVGSSITMPKIRCTELSVFGDIAGKVYRFQATVIEDWTFNIGLTPLALTQISMDITKDSTGFSGEVACQFIIASTELYGSASYSSAPTGGWDFEVGTILPANVNLTDLAKDILKLLKINLPSYAPKLILTDLAFSFNTATEAFVFQCATSLEIAGSTVSIGLEISNSTFAGLLWVGDSYFEINFMNADQTKTLTAEWKATDEQKYLEFADIAQALGLPPPQIPKDLDLRLFCATLTYGFGEGNIIIQANSLTYGKAIFVSTAASGQNEYFVALSVGHPINISDLPLLDKVLSPGETCAIDDLKVIVSSGNISAETAATINQIIQRAAAGYPALPTTGMASPVGLSATVDFGGDKFPISLGMTNVSQNGGRSTANSTTVGQQQGSSQGSVSPTPPASSDGTVWFNIQKNFGPITIAKLGVRYSDGVLWFALNASMSVGGLTITLQGASIGSPIKSFNPQFNLQGLGIAYTNPPVEIGGGFAKVNPTGGATFEYDGTIVVKMPEWGLTAYGSYAELDGKPSMFIFVQVQGTFGGPPAFFVTGIVGGFGYNSSLRIPGQQEVISCPLVGGLANPSIIGGNTATPMQALTALTGGANPWVSHSLGETWVAAGLLFTTYELLHSIALLVVEFGNDLTIALLGISTARFPPENESPAYAQIQLQLEAILQPAKGFFGITANLTRNSFLIDPACVLRGGFAFYLWFTPNEHSGDFVVTLGGYNPNFDPPPWYPMEPKVGFSWSIDSSISLCGSAYFAITPSAIMAGGSLSVNFHDGNLKAWFNANADLIIWWKPFHFAASIGVTVGASYKMNMGFTTKTYKVELVADLILWGPPTGGTVKVHWWVISFTVDFGASKTSDPGKIDCWSDFQTLLPASHDSVKIIAINGLTSQETNASAAAHHSANGSSKWIVRSDNFQFSTSSVVPSYQMFLGSRSQNPFAQKDHLNISPMQMTKLVSTHRVSLAMEGGPEIDLTAGWVVQASSGNVPKALWGTGSGTKLQPGDQQLINDQLVGMRFTVPPPSLGHSAGEINIEEDLSYDPLSPPGIIPLASGLLPTGDIAESGQNSISIIESEIMSEAVDARNKLYAALQMFEADPGTNDSLPTLASRAGYIYAYEPLIVSGQPS